MTIIHASYLVRGRTSEVRERWSSPAERCRWQDSWRLRRRPPHSSVSCTHSRTFSPCSHFFHLSRWSLHSKRRPFCLLRRTNHLLFHFRRSIILVCWSATILYRAIWLVTTVNVIALSSAAASFLLGLPLNQNYSYRYSSKVESHLLSWSLWL